MKRDYGTANLSWWQGFRDEIATTAPVGRDRLLLGALPVLMILYLIALFVWLGWWGVPATMTYLSSVVALRVITARSEQSPAAKAALAALIPAICVGLLAAIPKALGLI